MTFDEEQKKFYWKCRCNSIIEISEEQLEAGTSTSALGANQTTPCALCLPKDMTLPNVPPAHVSSEFYINQLLTRPPDREGISALRSKNSANSNLAIFLAEGCKQNGQSSSAYFPSASSAPL
jgi:hypothetical protein